MTINLDLATLTLSKGAHDDCTDGTCLYEAYNLLRFNEATDSCPADVSRVLHGFGISLNDTLPDDRRQELKQFLPRPDGTDLLAGTRDDGLDKVRGYMAVDWLIRTYTPAFLDLAGLTAEATALRDLRRIVDLAAVEAAQPAIDEANSKASAARSAADSAADSAARSAADSAARSAADLAADSAAYLAADLAADLAAYLAADSAARSAARSAADLAAYLAADLAADSAARSAARSAAEKVFAPTVAELQTSAIALFAAMIKPELVAA